ncbi:GHKL domain-containing protein [Lachnospiraceae bacterium KH1T2]|nr:GHKL domain-containing protein [Lachnospiraceae bacterium KH1T2]
MQHAAVYQTIYFILEYGGHLIDAAIIASVLNFLFEPIAPKFQTKTVITLFSIFCLLSLSFTHIISNSNSNVWTLTLFICAFVWALTKRCSIYMKLIFSSFLGSALIYCDLLSALTLNTLFPSFVRTASGYLLVFFFRRVISKIIAYLLISRMDSSPFRMPTQIPSAYLTGMMMFSFYQLFFAMIFMSCYMYRLDYMGHHSISLQLIIILFTTSLTFMIYHFFFAAIYKLQEQTAALLHEKELEMQSEYLKQQISINIATRRFRHDFKNHIFCMQGLLHEKKYDELQKYISEIEDMKFMKLTERFCKEESLNVMLNQKKKKADDANVPIEINVHLSDVPLNNTVSLCTLIANLCDNAIEASENVSNPKVQVSMADEKGFLSILVRNRTNENVLKSNPAFKTSKLDHPSLHGQGIRIIRRILKDLSAISNCESTDNHFCWKILIPRDTLSATT